MTLTQRRKSILRRCVVTGLALVTALVVAFGSATTASAALTVTVINTDGEGISSRSAPQLAAKNGYGAPANATVVAHCWTWGDAVGPYTNRLWWQITYAGRTFWAPDRYLSTPNIANQPPAGQPQCGVAPAPPPPAPTADTRVWVGSPIQGTWDLPAARGGDGPTVHHWLSQARDQGNWAVDLIVGVDKPVILYAAPQVSSLAITVKVDQIGAACGGGLNGGQFVTVGFYNGTTRVGSATYGHIVPSVSVGQTLNRWNTEIGKVGKGYPKNEKCWTGPHVHFQMFSVRNYACFNKEYGLGSPINPTNFLGFTGGNVASGQRRACA